MATRMIASTSRACILCLQQTQSKRTATTRTSRLGIMLQGRPTQKAVLTSRRGRMPQSQAGKNPQYLQQLRPAPGAWTKHKRAGRSHASRMNRRGSKGQLHNTSRTYVGGSTPVLTKMIPKRVILPKEPGSEMAQLHVDRLAYYVRQGRIDASQPVTLKELAESGCCQPKQGGVRLYGTLSPSFLDASRTFPKLEVIVTKASPKAIRTVEGAGGIIVARYHNKLGARAASRPDRFLHQGREVPRLADPVSKRDLDYYSSPANRGYIWLKMLQRARMTPSQPPQPVATSVLRPPGPEGLENPPSRRAEEA